MKMDAYAKRLLLILVLLPMILGAEVRLENPDKPEKGIWKFRPALEWSVEEAGDEIISSVEFVNIHDNGTIYFFDYRNHRIIALNSSGEKLISFGRQGEGPGEIKSAWDMSLNGDWIVVHDTGGYHFFDLKGEYIRTIRYSGESEGLISPEMMLKSKEEEDGQSLSIMKFADQSEILLKKMASPVRLVAQGGGIRLRVRDVNIVTGLKTACNDKGIVFGQSGTYRLFVADHAGHILRSFAVTGRPRPEIPEQYKESRFTRLKLNGSLLGKGMINQLVRCIPKHGPYFTDLFIHDSGLVFVMLPEYDSKSPRRFDVFSPEGKYLYRGIMEMPDGMGFNTHSFAISGNTLVMFTAAPDEEFALRKFSIQIPPAR